MFVNVDSCKSFLVVSFVKPFFAPKTFFKQIPDKLSVFIKVSNFGSENRIFGVFFGNHSGE